MQRRRYSAGGRAGRRPSVHSRAKTNTNRSRYTRRGPRSQAIDPSRLVKAARFVEEEEYTPVHTFNDFAIAPGLKKNLAARGFTEPTQIQDRTIPLALQGKDIVGIANTGTGKTAAFLLPLLTRLAQNPGTRAIILAPTRELAVQIREEVQSFAKGSGLHDTLLIGGVSINRQLNELKRSPAIVIGTPGRVNDHLDRHSLTLGSATQVVLDEVDRMLDMGFINDIRTILSHLPSTCQSLYFSATISREIEQLIATFTKNPITVMARTSDTSDAVEQSVEYYSDKAQKLEKLHDLLTAPDVSKALVFTETKYGADRLTKTLLSRGFKADAIHGNKSQNKRQRALNQFKTCDTTVLVATDVAARGIDVDGITHVINYEMPQTYDDYTHRIGRAGRAGAIGYATTLVQGAPRT